MRTLKAPGSILNQAEIIGGWRPPGDRIYLLLRAANRRHPVYAQLATGCQIDQYGDWNGSFDEGIAKLSPPGKWAGVDVIPAALLDRIAAATWTVK